MLRQVNTETEMETKLKTESSQVNKSTNFIYYRPLVQNNNFILVYITKY